jgi:hypothetical protein
MKMKIVACLLAAAISVPPALAGEFAPMALNSLSAPPARIVAAPVLDQSGTVIGKVKAVATDQDGRPSALSYVADKRLAVIAAQAVSYDAQKNIVVADISKARLGDQVAAN